MSRRWIVTCLAFGLAVASASDAMAQSYGVERGNTLMPACGGMAGASNAQPQDVTSSLNGNPATITQFAGTQFLFGGAWVEPTFNLTQSSNLPVLGAPLIHVHVAIGRKVVAKDGAELRQFGNCRRRA